MISIVREDVAVYLLAENRLLREALARILGKMGGIRLVGVSPPSSEALGEIVANEPEVLLFDSIGWRSEYPVSIRPSSECAPSQDNSFWDGG